MVRILAIADEKTRSLSVGRIRSIDPDLVVACGDLPFDYLDYIATATSPWRGRSHRARWEE